METNNNSKPARQYLQISCDIAELEKIKTYLQNCTTAAIVEPQTDYRTLGMVLRGSKADLAALMHSAGLNFQTVQIVASRISRDKIFLTNNKEDVYWKEEKSEQKSVNTGSQVEVTNG